MVVADLFLCLFHPFFNDEVFQFESCKCKSCAIQLKISKKLSRLEVKKTKRMPQRKLYNIATI
jgi:hypothetical protein